MTEPVVVIAWQDQGDTHRRAAFRYVRRLYARMGVRTIVASAEPFTKARALNVAIRELPEGAVIVQSDPDSFMRWGDYTDAVEEAFESDGLVIPYDRALYLNEHASGILLADQYLDAELAEVCDEVVPNGVGNVTVYSRRTWEAAGGYDERFPLWAGDDAAFAIAAGNLVAPMRRLEGDVIHLWHPRPEASVPGSKGYFEQMLILEKYRDADALGPEAVRELVESR